MKLRGLLFCVSMLCAAWSCFAADPLTLERAAQRVVKLYGAGGLGRAHGYGTGIFVSPKGHILTVLGSMLEAAEVRAVLWDGRRMPARLLAAHPQRSIAVLKIEVEDVPFFDLSGAKVEPGEIVYALSNQFNIAAGPEVDSVQRGAVAAVATLDESVGRVLILDATACNPGAAGGAVVDSAGRLLAVLNKEYRDPATRTWVHTAVFASDLSVFARAVIDGKLAPESSVETVPSDAGTGRAKPLDLRGLILLPDVLDQTPAFIDGTERDSPAAKAGLRGDDLILYVGTKLVQSVVDFHKAAAALPADKPWTLVVLRGEAMRTIELPPRAAPPKGSAKDAP
jgi:serine protease Do